MAKALTDIRSLARTHTETSINVLAGIMRCEDAPHAARVAAAAHLLDRGWGKPPQAHAGENGEGNIRVIVRHIIAGRDVPMVDVTPVAQDDGGSDE